MGIYVKTPDGKQPLHRDITAKDITSALGYIPANPNDIVTPENIDSNSDTFYIVDGNDNIVAQVDRDGLHVIDVKIGTLVDGKSVSELIEDAVSNINIPDVDIDLSDIESNDDTFYIVDKNDNTVAKIDREGLHTIEVELGGSGETKVKVKEHIANSHIHTSLTEKETVATHIADDDIHVTQDDRDRWDSKNMASSDSVTQLTNTVNTHIKQYEGAIDATDDEVFYIVDNNDNIIAQVDSDGLHVLDVKIGKDGQSVAEMIKAEIPDVDLSNYYTKSETYSKTEVEDKIGTVEDIAKGANRAKVFNTYDDLIAHLNSIGYSTYTIGQNFYIRVLNVPDLWVSSVTDGSSGTYSGNADDLLNDLASGSVTVNCYVLSVLETQKVNLTDYVTKTQQQTALKNMSEEIVSDKEEFHIVDDADRIVATIDKDGIHTTTVETDSLILAGKEFTTDTFAAKYTEGLRYTLIDSSYAVSGIGTATDTEIVIPPEHEGIPVTSIRATAFQSNTNITSVYIPSSVTSIDDSAFRVCTNLKSVILSNGVKTLRSSAFSGCTSLEKIILPSSVTTLWGYVFNGCTSLRTIYIPKNLATITIGHVFLGCNTFLKIYCGAESKPDGWVEEWNDADCDVYWGIGYPDVSEATHATSADSATTATTADSATTATSLAPISGRTWTTGTIDNSGAHPSVTFSPVLTAGLYGVRVTDAVNISHEGLMLYCKSYSANATYVTAGDLVFTVYRDTFSLDTWNISEGKKLDSVSVIKLM